MNMTQRATWLTSLFVLAFAATQAQAQVTIDDTAAHGLPRTWNGNTVTAAQLDAGSPGGSFDPTGSDKLIVAIGYKSSGTAAFTGVTYNGTAMSEAVQHGSSDNRGTTGIFYLDNYTGGKGDVVASLAGSSFGIAVSAWAVSGTAEGVGTFSSAQAATTSMNVGAGSLVIAQHAVNDGGLTLSAVSPLVTLLSHAGNSDGSFGSGYQNDVTAGSYSSSFSGGGSSPSISSAEFPPPPPPAGTVIMIK